MKKPLRRFTPVKISGCQLWLDSTRGITLSSSNVTNWSDLSGNSRGILQETDNNRPTYVTNSVNGRPIVRFDGTNDYLASGTITGLDNMRGFTVFLVGKTSSAVTASGSVLNFQNSVIEMNINTTSVVTKTGGFSAPTAHGDDNTSTSYATPVMTSNTTPSPYVASDAYDYGSSWKLWVPNLLDIDSISNGVDGWFKFDFGLGNGKIINKYDFYYGVVSPSQYPKSWRFQGSNDNISWTTLNTITNYAQTYSPTYNMWIGQNGPNSGYFTFSNSTAYRYYRIFVDAFWTYDMSMWKIKLVEAVGSVVTTSGSVSGETASTPKITTIVYDGSLSTNADKQKLYWNGVQKTLSFDTTVPNSLNTTNKYSIGASTTGSTPYPYDVAEVVLYNRVISTIEQQKLMAYLGNKYSISV